MPAERFPVEASHIMMFARAIGDPNPAYRDAESPQAEAAGGIVAPPTFAMASWQFEPEHPLRPDPAKPWFGSGREPTGRVSSGGGGSRGGAPRSAVHGERRGVDGGVLTTRLDRGVGRRMAGEKEREAQRLMAESFGRPHFNEGVQSFLEKRPPAWVPDAD